MNIVLKGPNEEINLNFVSVNLAGSQRHLFFTITVLGLILNVSRLVEEKHQKLGPVSHLNL